jgi:hypothetical protein
MGKVKQYLSEKAVAVVFNAAYYYLDIKERVKRWKEWKEQRNGKRRNS